MRKVQFVHVLSILVWLILVIIIEIDCMKLYNPSSSKPLNGKKRKRYLRSDSMPYERTTSIKLGPFYNSDHEREHRKLFRSTDIEYRKLYNNSQKRRKRYDDLQKEIPFGMTNQEELIKHLETHKTFSKASKEDRRVGQALLHKVKNLRDDLKKKDPDNRDTRKQIGKVEDVSKVFINRAQVNEVYAEKAKVELINAASESYYSPYIEQLQKHQERNQRANEDKEILNSLQPLIKYKMKHKNYFYRDYRKSNFRRNSVG